MLDRKAVIQCIVDELRDVDCIVSALGYISRDLYALTATMRVRCFYCMGSMGSIVPLALGVSLSRPEATVMGLEGDGAILMNLGALVTLYRYGSGNIRLVIFDNGCYESTGGQPSQPERFRVEDVCMSIPLPTQIATRLQDVREFINNPLREDLPNILIVKVACAPPSARITEPPAVIAKRFGDGLKHGHIA